MRTAVRLLAVLAILLAGAWFGGRAWLARSLPQREGIIRADADARITFDAKGIPQVWAKTDADAFFAIGWLHGSDRLFQMELVRRLARGELSEVFGEAAYETDVHQRQIGFARRADPTKLTPAARVALQRYVEGVNAAIAQSRVLPPEFVILRLTPRPWTIEDCLAISAYQTWFSHELMDQDRAYQKLLAKLGMSASALTNAGHPWSPPTVPATDGEAAKGEGRKVEDAELACPLRPDCLTIATASNSWVVAPERSASKAALHASDPHLAIDQAPGLWYLAGLHSDEGLNVAGVTYAGGPFVVMGHNAEIAFSFTVASVDLIDYFDDSPRSAHREELRVKGEERPRVLEVRHGTRGVMVDDRTSLYWSGFDFEPAAMIDAGLRLQRASNFEDFRGAVTKFGALDANWIYSDRNGNIGYQLGAPVPVRNYDTYVRQRAGDADVVWQGYRARDETPHALNPGRGYLASCNNQPVSEEFPYRIPGFYDPYRITRAHSQLAALPSATVQDMQGMQLDPTSGLAARWRSLAADGARAAGLKEEERLLSAWDGRMTSDSRAAALFSAWWRRLPRAVFEDDLGSEWETARVLLEEALTNRTPLVDDLRTPRVETLVDASSAAMREAKEIVGGRTWGEACTLAIRHPLSRVKALDWFLDLDRGPFPGQGDPGTLNANFYRYRHDTRSFRAQVGPSMRFVLDWSDVDGFSLTGALGQSGNPFSPHYDDFLGVTEWNVPFSRDKVFAAAKSQVVMRR